MTNVLTIIGLFLTSASVAFAGYELNRGRHESRASFLVNMNAWMFADPELRTFYYRLDYGRWTFDPETFRLSPEEQHLDKLLYMLDTIQRLIESKHLQTRDLTLLQMDAPQILGNPEVQKYLAWLDSEFPELVERPYGAARRMTQTLPAYV